MSVLEMTAVGRMVDVALEAADILSGEGIEAGVCNARFVKPIDEEMVLELARGHRLLVTMEDNALIGGFGEGVAAILERSGTSCGLVGIGLPDRFVGHGKVPDLFRLEGMDAATVVRTVRSELRGEAGE